MEEIGLNNPSITAEFETVCSPSGGFPEGDNAGNNSKPVWNKRVSNGPVDNGPGLMGGAWPVLSKSAVSGVRVSDSGPVSVSQGIEIASSSSSTALLPASSSSSVVSSVTVRPVRQNSMRRESGSNVHANGGVGGGEGSNNNNNNNRDTGNTRNAGVGEHTQYRNTFRRGNGGNHHNNYGGRRGGGGDHDRGNNDWNHHRSFNGRDNHFQPRGTPRNFMRGPPIVSNPPPFVQSAPVSMRPFGNPMVMPAPADMQMVYFHPRMHFIPHYQPAMYIPAQDPHLRTKLLNQIEYYFSEGNLIRDTYLRMNMDTNGWVPISLIAGFKKVSLLTDNIQLILEALQSSSVIEAQGDKIRRRGDYMRWILPPSVRFPGTSGLQSSSAPNLSTLTSHIQRVTLDERATNANDEAFLRSSSGDLRSLSHSTNIGATSSGWN